MVSVKPGLEWTGLTQQALICTGSELHQGYNRLTPALLPTLISSISRPPILRAQRPCAHLRSNHKLQLHSQMTENYSSCFLHFNKGWSVVSAQNNCSSSPSSRQSVLIRARLKLDKGACTGCKSWMLKAGLRTDRESARATFVELINIRS